MAGSREESLMADLAVWLVALGEVAIVAFVVQHVWRHRPRPVPVRIRSRQDPTQRR